MLRLQAIAACAFVVANSVVTSPLQGQATAGLSFMGNIQPYDDHWFVHPGWGWTYAYIEPSGVTFAQHSGTWFWTSPSVWPYIFDYSGGTWLYSSGSADVREWFYNYSTHLWEKGSVVAGPVQNLNAELAQAVAESGAPSMAIAITEGSRIVATGAAGTRRLGADIPVTVNDVYSAGSIAKPVTATVAARLVEDGVVSWETTLGSAFPAVEMQEGWSGVTLSQLLSHTAGAPGNLANPAQWRGMTGTPTEQRAALVEAVTGEAPAYPPGEGYHYSNVGYALAAAILEGASGKSWETLVEEELFYQQGMLLAGPGVAGTAGADDQPLGHTPDGVPVEPGPSADLPVVLAPAGSVHMSVRELALFGALHGAGATENSPFMGAAGFAALQDTLVGSPFNYGRGWMVGYYPGLGEGSLVHDGSNSLNYAIVVVAPEFKVAGAAVTNIYTPQAAQALRRVLMAEIESRIPVPERIVQN